MARKYAVITADDLRTKIAKACVVGMTKDQDYDSEDFDDVTGNVQLDRLLYRGIYHLNKVQMDMSKVYFDTENLSAFDGYTAKELCGFQTIGDFTFLGVSAGGDWEFPVFFIIYFDGKTLRAYVPEDGNTYNKEWKTAYGSEQNSAKYKGNFDDDDEFELEDTPIADIAALTNDIKTRFAIEVAQ